MLRVRQLDDDGKQSFELGIYTYAFGSPYEVVLPITDERARQAVRCVRACAAKKGVRWSGEPRDAVGEPSGDVLDDWCGVLEVREECEAEPLLQHSWPIGCREQPPAALLDSLRVLDCGVGVERLVEGQGTCRSVSGVETVRSGDRITGTEAKHL